MSRAVPLLPGPFPSAAPLGRLVSLSAVLVPLARRGALSRMGRVYPWLTAVGYAALLGLSRGAKDVRPAAVVAAALGLMSWAAGAVAFESARDAEPDDRERGLRAVASERGFSHAEQQWARAIATIRVVARAVGLPGMALVLLAGASAPRGGHVVLVLTLAPCVAAYGLALGAVLGGVARLCARALPRHGRILFALVVLGPYALPSESGSLPSIPAAFSLALHRLGSLGESNG